LGGRWLGAQNAPGFIELHHFKNIFNIQSILGSPVAIPSPEPHQNPTPNTVNEKKKKEKHVCAYMLQEGVKFRMTLGVAGHLKERLEEIVDDVLETVDQLVGLEHVTEITNTINVHVKISSNGHLTLTATCLMWPVCFLVPWVTTLDTFDWQVVNNFYSTNQKQLRIGGGRISERGFYFYSPGLNFT
jgi:hypothetical protein